MYRIARLTARLTAGSQGTAPAACLTTCPHWIGVGDVVHWSLVTTDGLMNQRKRRLPQGQPRQLALQPVLVGLVLEMQCTGRLRELSSPPMASGTNGRGAWAVRVTRHCTPGD
jgi:hypothetical protein